MIAWKHGRSIAHSFVIVRAANTKSINKRDISINTLRVLWSSSQEQWTQALGVSKRQSLGSGHGLDSLVHGGIRTTVHTGATIDTLKHITDEI